MWKTADFGAIVWKKRVCYPQQFPERRVETRRRMKLAATCRRRRARVEFEGKALFFSAFREVRPTSEPGGSMALYRTLYYGDVTVGVGGRITIPQDIRDDLSLEDGDMMTVRVEESSNGTRQIVLWRTEQQPHGPED